jgi:hypothetical protein
LKPESAVALATELTKNTEKFLVGGRFRIPDFVEAKDLIAGLPKQIIKVENVQYQWLSRQLKDYARLVGPEGRVNVALPPGARVSRPLQRAFGDADNPLFRIDLPQ